MLKASVLKHMKYPSHIQRVAEYHVAREQARTQADIPEQRNSPPELVHMEREEHGFLDPIPSPWHPFDGLPDEQSHFDKDGANRGCADESSIYSESSTSDSSSGISDASQISEYDSNNEADDEEWELPRPGPQPSPGVNPAEPAEPDTSGRRNQCDGEKDWWPYRSKEYLVASLLIGYTHSIMSRSLYNYVKAMFKLFDIKLPDWNTVRREKKALRGLLGMDVHASKSILNIPTYGLSLPKVLAQEVANPIVSPLIDYFPEEAHGRGIYKLSQSKKWLEELDPISRAPMCRVVMELFYMRDVATQYTV
ncbi:hypothetical protein PtB15_4B650 [Puccinia triticina]|nr:hypothetical protein PtB15_4B650 [Puccinia triticina]